MCGIVAYLGSQPAYPILIKGMRRLEYRGYDSAGITLIDSKMTVYKTKGRVDDLVSHTKEIDTSPTMGMGHTRWATHGAPNNVNAHPHKSSNGRISIIHNGIIENYDSIKRELIDRGHEFISETDTEVFVNLIQDIIDSERLPLEEAVRQAMQTVVGAYAIVVMSVDEPDKFVAARMSSPLVIGLGEEEYFVASDATPIVEYTRNVVYLNDGEIAVLERSNGLTLRSLENEVQTPYVQELELKLEKIEKAGYDFFMHKEIHEQPDSIRDSLRGRLDAEKGIIALGGIREFEQKLINAKRIIIVACGTSWHSGLVAEYMFEDFARVPVEVEYASEFRYRNPILSEDDIVIAISQSGETADTLAAIRMAKSKGATIFGICNVVGSSISRETDAGAYTHAGPEIGVASTKAFTAQLSVLALMALTLGQKNGKLPESRGRLLLSELALIPEKVKRALECEEQIKEIAQHYQFATNFLYLGRGYNFPVALEGALKLKEISYIHAEGYPAAEMKHGPIALIDQQMPVVVLATNEGAYEKIISNVEEVKARQGKVIVVTTRDDDNLRKLADHVIQVPRTEDPFTPILSVIPLQLLAYYIALLRGCDVDKPRNLAKSVTVE